LVLDTLGLAQAKAGKASEAAATLRLALNLAPALASTRLHLAEQLAAIGDTKGAGQVLTSLDASKLNKADQTALGRLQSTIPK